MVWGQKGPWNIYHGQECQSLDQIAQGPVQPDFETFQWWDIHNFSGKSVPVSHYSQRASTSCTISICFLLIYAAQDTIGCLACEHTLLPHVQHFIHQYPQSFSTGLVSICPCPSLYWYWWLLQLRCRTLLLDLLSFMMFTWPPPLKPVTVPSLQRTRSITQVVVVLGCTQFHDLSH